MSILIHHGGKNGDLVYALPVMRALARERGQKIHLTTSALCFQLVPLLFEQPYIEDVAMDYEHSYKTDNGSIVPWQFYSTGEGLNLSPQPAFYRPNAPVRWTWAYAEVAGVKELTASDKIAFPTLWNHRQWYWEHEVKSEGRKPWSAPNTLVLAPESETLRCVPLWVWQEIAAGLAGSFDAIFVIGQNPDATKWPAKTRDLRGLTTVSSAARFLSEATLVISANSLPWHIARHAGTPVFCLQDQYLERCTPVDTPYVFYTSDKRADLITGAKEIARKRPTTLHSEQELRQLREVA